MSRDLEHGDLADAQSGAIGHRQCRLVLEAGRRVEQARDLVAAQYHRQVAGPAHPNQPARQIGAVERLGEQEPQRRHDAVHGRHRNAGLALGDLEPADVLGRRRVGRSPQEGREAPDVADVVALRRHREVAHVHVVDQPLAQRADRGIGNGSWSSVGSLVEEAESVCPNRTALNQAVTTDPLPLPSPRAPLPRSGFVPGRNQLKRPDRNGPKIRRRNTTGSTPDRAEPRPPRSRENFRAFAAPPDGSSDSEPNRPNTVAPDPDMRAATQPGVAASRVDQFADDRHRLDRRLLQVVARFGHPQPEHGGVAERPAGYPAGRDCRVCRAAGKPRRSRPAPAD